MDSDSFPLCSGVIPAVTTDQMREVDRLMIEVYHIALLQMMEHAGRNLAHLARLRFLNVDPAGKRVHVLAGTGGNGGGAMVCARWLHNAGADVRVILASDHARLAPVPAHQLESLLKIDVPIFQAGEMESSSACDLVVDGLIGYGLNGAPRGATAQLIAWANATSVPILALDVPSGIDSTSGEAYNPTIRASATLTLALPKTGLLFEHAKSYVGELYLANISVPRKLYAHPALGLSVGNIFRNHDVVRLSPFG